MLSLLLFSISHAGLFLPMLLVTHNSTLRRCNRFKPGTHHKLQHELACKLDLGFTKFDPHRNRLSNFCPASTLQTCTC